MGQLELTEALGGDESLQEIDAEGISQYLPDELEDSEKGTPQKVEQFAEEPASELEMRIRSTPAATTPTFDPQPATPDDGDGEGDESGGSGGGGEEETSSGGQKGGDGGGEQGTGTSGGGDGPSGPDHTKRVDLAKVRIYCSDTAKGRYRLLFEPKTDDAAHLRVFVIGEVGAEPAEVTAYSVNGGPEVEISSKGVIGPLALKKGQRAVLDVVLRNSLRCALGVTAYAN